MGKIPTWFKIFLLGISIFSWLIWQSISISFIYENESFIVALLMYLALAISLSVGVILRFNSYNSTVSTSSQKETLIKKLQICFALYFLGPFLFGICFSGLVPITADLLASEFAIHEYKAVKVEQYAKSIRNLSTLYVVDVKNNEASFVIKNEMLNQLNLHAGDKLVVRGRNCIAGFVIDNINGIERK